MATGNGRQNYLPRTRDLNIDYRLRGISLLVNLHETLNESGWVDLVHDATKGKKKIQNGQFG